MVSIECGIVAPQHPVWIQASSQEVLAISVGTIPNDGIPVQPSRPVSVFQMDNSGSGDLAQLG